MNSTDVLPCFESPSDAPTRQGSSKGGISRRQSDTDNQQTQKGKKTNTTARNNMSATSYDEERRFIVRLLKREPQAWQEFLGRYEKLIVSRVLATCREFGVVARPELIEDCGAEVMAVLFHQDMKGLRRFQGHSKLSTWLAVITRRTTMTFLKRQQRETVIRRPNDSQFDLATLAEKTNENNSELDQEDHRKIEDCLKQLKKSDRLALMLYFDRKLSYAEIGRELGISENAVGPKLHRAQKRLKKLMETGQKES